MDFLTKRELDQVLEIDERETKLPRWAQEKLERSRRLVQEAVTKAEQARLDTDPEGSVAVLNDLGTRDGIGLGKRPRVSFKTSSGRIDTMVREIAPGERALEVYAHDGTLQVAPHSSNVVYVTVKSR